ncbi:hypothetical protein Leryth_014192 [Lithospermum erythrorhizon]|nr:hypothetical protein Leryth_014192 [Lithospermum erythrorhizon]
MEKVMNKLRNLDAYPKINEDFYSRSLSGGVITLVSSLVMLLLFFSELRLYFHTVKETTLLVDTSRGEKLHINFDITFPATRCSLLSVDSMDISGEQHLDIRHDIFKKRIDPQGNVIEVKPEGLGAQKIEKPLQRHGGRLDHNETYCGSCYGAEMSDHDCCNTCEEVREAYQKKGWGMTNTDLIDQVSSKGLKMKKGKGATFMDLWKLIKWQAIFISSLHNPHGMYQYFVKVVPTIYTDIRGRIINSNQFSVTEHYKSVEEGQTLPGVFFFYDLSPIKVTFKEEHVSFLHFVTNVCAIVGGIFTVAGIVDSFVYHGHKALKKKREIGKLG